MSATTPTTVVQGAVSAPIFTHLPNGDSAGQRRPASVSFTMVTGDVSARSSSVKPRPATTRMPAVERNAASTGLKNGERISLGSESRPGSEIRSKLNVPNGAVPDTLTADTPATGRTRAASVSYTASASPFETAPSTN